MKHRNDPDGNRLPIKLDTTTNGEFLPEPLEKRHHQANALAQTQASENARRLGQSRRRFMTSVCGAASTLLAFNEVNAATGKKGSFYDLPDDAALDQDVAMASLGDKEFIFDIQGHHTGPVETFQQPGTHRYESRRGFQFMEQGKCDYPLDIPDIGHMNCFNAEAFIKEIYLDSDTDVAVLTFSPSTEENMTLSHAEAAATREMVDAMDGEHRLLIHGRVIPNAPGDLERMQSIVDEWNVSAWKTYTQWSLDNEQGWWLDDDEFGQPLFDAARETGVKMICVHKGLPLPFPLMGKKNLEYRLCRDVGPAAKRNPDMDLIVYHSGYDIKMVEGEFVEGNPTSAVDILIQSMLDAGLGPNSNVYAELGTTWRYLMRDPDIAAHTMGKLLKYVGEDRVLWGTDSIWYGSPQDQIQAFRTFQISEEFQEKYGYPEITPEIRAKVFGLNAAKPYGISVREARQRADADPIGKFKHVYRDDPDPTFKTYGPKTRREFFELARAGHD